MDLIKKTVRINGKVGIVLTDSINGKMHRVDFGDGDKAWYSNDLVADSVIEPDTHNPHAENILSIIDKFGMKGRTAAQAMEITYNTFQNYRSPSQPRHKFSKESLRKLINFIKKEADNLHVT